MSGIYIKGVKLPKRCSLCGWYSLPDYGCRVDSKGRVIKVKDALSGRPDWCPIVEVPDHGRLIDADALIVRMKKDPLWQLVDQYGVESVIEAAPTIMSADKEEDNGET